MPEWLVPTLAGFVSALALWLVKRATARVDELERENRGFKDRLHSIELQMAKDLPTKDDVREVKLHVESLAATMSEIRDMVIRLDAQHATTQR